MHITHEFKPSLVLLILKQCDFVVNSSLSKKVRIIGVVNNESFVTKMWTKVKAIFFKIHFYRQ